MKIHSYSSGSAFCEVPWSFMSHIIVEKEFSTEYIFLPRAIFNIYVVDFAVVACTAYNNTLFYFIRTSILLSLIHTTVL